MAPDEHQKDHRPLYRETFTFRTTRDSVTQARASAEEAATRNEVEILEMREIPARRGKVKLQLTVVATSHDINELRATLGEESPLWVLVHNNSPGDIVGELVIDGVVTAAVKGTQRGWWTAKRRRRGSVSDENVHGDISTDPPNAS